MKKQSFEDYVLGLSDQSNRDFSEHAWNLLKTAYDLHVGLAQFFDPGYRGSDNQIEAGINAKLRKLYKIKFHNIGKNPYQRYFASEGHYPWLKLEHYLISHFYAIQKDESRISNKSIAINLGWLLEKESNPEIIDKAVRKVADNLAILKNDRKTISVDQYHVYGKNGSYHIIRANWLAIIPLYQVYDPNVAISIRMRKGIRYRILSLIYYTVKSFSENLVKLLKLQKKKYLTKLVTMDLDKFADDRFIMRHILNQVCGAHPEWVEDLKNLIPEYNFPELKLTIKHKSIFEWLSNPVFAKEMKERYQVQLNLVPMF